MKKRLSLTAATIVAAVLMLTGCGTSSGAGGPAASPSGESTSSGAASSRGTATTAADTINALTATGPAQAPTVPDMKPIIKNAKPELPATVTDSTGKTITVQHANRVIALDLYGTLTDTVIGLGLQDRLVGRGVSDTQQALQHLPVVSKDGVDLNTEAVLNLKPDLVLTNMTIGSADNYRQLEAAGVTVVRFAQSPHLSAIRGEITQVGAAFGMTKAATRLADRTDTQLAKAKKTVAALRAATPDKPRAVVLYVRGSGGIFFILGADYGAGDVLNFLGLDDVAKDHGITSVKPANAESLVSLDPQIILTMTDGVKSTGGIAGLLKRPGVAETTAGRNKRIITAADSQLLSYGPRTPQSLTALARAIYTSHP